MDFSSIDSLFPALHMDPPSQLMLMDSAMLAGLHYPPFPPDLPVLLMGVPSPAAAAQIGAVLRTVYPPRHPVRAISGGVVMELTLETLGLAPVGAHLFLPAMETGASFEAFAEVVAHLRAPDGCPWDREQTHLTLRPHLLEEAYEALNAMDSLDTEAMAEEFGDLLLQVVLNAQIASEAGNFNMTRVLSQIREKIVRRHPHVFGDLEVEDVRGVLQNWERLKETERSRKNDSKGLLDGVPAVLPALTQAQEYQDRAARVGFDWPEIEGVLDKVREEIEEIKNAADLDQVRTELGDLFFVLVNLSRWRKVDAESALREANQKFRKRFRQVELGAQSEGRRLTDLTLAEMDEYWNKAKQAGL